MRISRKLKNFREIRETRQGRRFLTPKKSKILALRMRISRRFLQAKIGRGKTRIARWSGDFFTAKKSQKMRFFGRCMVRLRQKWPKMAFLGNLFDAKKWLKKCQAPYSYCTFFDLSKIAIFGKKVEKRTIQILKKV